MKSNPITPPTAKWLLAALLSTSCLQAEEAAKPADKNSANYIVFNATGVDQHGSNASWQARQQRSSDLQGGIQAFHYETALEKNWFLEMNARGIFDENDYSLEFIFEKPEFNRTTIGFENFRTWSDAHTVTVDGWDTLQTFDPTLSLDRSKFYIETTFMPDETLDLTLRYTLRTREGDKASTRWTEARPGGDRRYYVPTFLDIDETQHSFEFEFEKRKEKTTIEGAMRYDYRDHDNALRVHSRPDSLPDETYRAQEESMQSDTIGAHGSIQHKVSEQLTLTASALFSQLDGEVNTTRLDGDSLYPTVLDANYDLVHEVDADFDLNQYVMTFAALYQPSSNWVITPSLRFEQVDQRANGLVDETDDPEPTETNDDYGSITAKLGLRYTGLQNWTLYADILGSHTEGNLDEEGATSYIQRDSDYERDMAKFTLGGNWYAHRKLTVAFQYYHKIKENSYSHLSDNDLTAYPAFITKHEQDVDNASIRLNWRVLPNLTSITRVDYQHATIDTTGYADPLSAGLTSVESGDRERFIYSESLTYMATQRLNLFGSLNYVQDTLTTPASDYYSSLSADNTIVAESQMDYLTVQLTGVYLYDDSTEITVSATALVSDNSYDNSAATVPYGNDLQEFTATASIAKWLSSNKKVTFGYGYYDYSDDYTGGDTDFNAHVFTAKYEYRF